VSRTPNQTATVPEAKDYLAAWKAIHQMIAAGKSWSGRERNGCFLNTKDRRFANISAVSGFDFADDARAAAVVDWDHDGDLDIWFSNRTSPQVRFLENQLGRDAHYLALHLRGTSSNRDAIGARVEIELDRGPDAGTGRIWSETVSAGSGFVSQSSKWLHFGLGKRQSIRRIRVRWPGGEIEEFKGLPCDHHYQIVQGEKNAIPWHRAGAKTGATSQPIDIAAPDANSAIALSRNAAVALDERYPLRTDLPFIASDGKQTTLGQLSGSPVLVNLFATWCVPCMEELSAFAEDADRIRQQGTRIVALSIEQTQARATRSDVARALDRIAFPFDWGLATDTLLEALQDVENDLFFMSQPLPLPMSYLLDGKGQIAFIYRGRVDVDQLVADVAALGKETTSSLTGTLPFSGRWIAPPHGFRAGAYNKIGHVYAQRGDFAAAARSYATAAGQRPDFAALSNLGTALAAIGKTDEAVRFFRRAIELKPDSYQTHYNLGVILARQQELKQARQHFQRSLEIQPDFQPARDRLEALH
jgi:tetratricopeptide (TPR) repeat protein